MGADDETAAVGIQIRFIRGNPEVEVDGGRIGVSLTEGEKALLERWIKEGAKYEGHWAFEPVKTTQPPTIKDEDC